MNFDASQIAKAAIAQTPAVAGGIPGIGGKITEYTGLLDRAGSIVKDIRFMLEFVQATKQPVSNQHIPGLPFAVMDNDGTPSHWKQATELQQPKLPISRAEKEPAQLPSPAPPSEFKNLVTMVDGILSNLENDKKGDVPIGKVISNLKFTVSDLRKLIKMSGL